ncbi:hypothetical protein ACH41E_28130 [Streptomyces sp. NPDC020412]|uniref:hypothetical protein n=1 Tax=Streptomyces sp. NPDC020412 TaxID=3365073 RepID=UPI0037ACAD49
MSTTDGRRPETYDPGFGWEVRLAPGERVRCLEIPGASTPELIHIPTTVVLNGTPRGTAGLWLEPHDAEHLRWQLSDALDHKLPARQLIGPERQSEHRPQQVRPFDAAQNADERRWCA